MKTSNRTSFLFLIFTLAVQLSACGVAIPSPTPAAPTLPTLTPISSTLTVPSLIPIIPSITPTNTPTITITSMPDFCNSALWQDKIQVISQDRFTALEPGGPVEFDRILMQQNPAWADFRQTDHGEIRSAGVIFHETSSGPELGTGINPAVILVIYGVEHKWALPANGDLVTEVNRIRAVLHQRENYWILGSVDQSQYPMVPNAATYALYHYFGGDLSKLEDWCHIYLQVFNESPLKTLDR